MLNMPILRDITRAFYIGRTFRLMGLMIESGVPLLEGLQLTRNSVRNMLYRKLFDDLGRIDSQRPRPGQFADHRRLRAGGRGGNGAHGRTHRHARHGHRTDGRALRGRRRIASFASWRRFWNH